jgi:hypothetical protein
MATKIIYWRIYCETEGIWTYGYLDDTQGTPTTCFTNTSHTVNPNSYQDMTTTSLTVPEVKLAEELVKTGGNYRAESFKFTCPANQVTVYTVSWKFQLSVISSSYVGKSAWEGCKVDAIVGPDTVVGTITDDVASGVSVIPVSLTVIQNAQVGYEFFIGSDLIGEIISINSNALTVTLSDNTITTYTSGAYAKLQTRAIKNYEICGGPLLYTFGVNVLGGSPLAPNTDVNVVFNNVTNSSIDFRFQVEYLY